MLTHPNILSWTYIYIGASAVEFNYTNSVNCFQLPATDPFVEKMEKDNKVEEMSKYFFVFFYAKISQIMTSFAILPKANIREYSLKTKNEKHTSIPCKKLATKYGKESLTPLFGGVPLF